MLVAIEKKPLRKRLRAHTTCVLDPPVDGCEVCICLRSDDSAIEYMLPAKSFLSWYESLGTCIPIIKQLLNPPPPVTEQTCILCKQTGPSDTMAEIVAGWIHDYDCTSTEAHNGN